jgi:hypothetical protein
MTEREDLLDRMEDLKLGFNSKDKWVSLQEGKAVFSSSMNKPKGSWHSLNGLAKELLTRRY